MKYSTKPRHCAPLWTGMNNKNAPYGRKRWGGSNSGPKISTVGIIRMLFGALSRRTRRVFLEQERLIKTQQGPVSK